MRYAGFWKRLLAYSIDGILLQIALALWIMVTGLGPQFDVDLEQLMQAAGDPEKLRALAVAFNRYIIEMAALGAALSCFYNILFVASPLQATPGKRYYRMRVVNTDGSRLNLLQSALRHMNCLISQLPLGLGFAMAAFHREKAALHDAITGTRVIYEETVA
jgi:uncharacterized RDD family membrane protein YckC